eukprot:TRINITY_DN10363_c0_g1_i1.p2 TRINITY_DN10363_c0_g1~~TRINITY_DN10363_c0_g1_i1.p2  ORF type:complete len:259 (-),score=112.91 TRINITY_DN10363_c0_g1_i1:513-1289(-)
MADLDDFFAKKDKKKKGTKKFSKANTEVIAKNLVETERKEIKELERQDKEFTSQLSEERVNTKPQDDEEWDDYIENKKDYTGLKIDALTIQDEAAEPEEEETEINEDGEVVKVKKDESGPWNKIGSNTNNNEPQQDLIKEPEPSIQQPNVVGGSYVPPHMRGGGGSAPAAEPVQTRPTRRGRPVAAPDITNEVFFPSLASASQDSGPKGVWGKSDKPGDGGGMFEEVRDTGSGKNFNRQADAPRLALGNKFAALRDGD